MIPFSLSYGRKLLDLSVLLKKHVPVDLQGTLHRSFDLYASTIVAVHATMNTRRNLYVRTRTGIIYCLWGGAWQRGGELHQHVFSLSPLHYCTPKTVFPSPQHTPRPSEPPIQNRQCPAPWRIYFAARHTRMVNAPTSHCRPKHHSTSPLCLYIIADFCC